MKLTSIEVCSVQQGVKHMFVIMWYTILIMWKFCLCYRLVERNCDTWSLGARKYKLFLNNKLLVGYDWFYNSCWGGVIP